MEKKEKLSFFKKMFLVITDFRTYPFLIKHEKFYKSLVYIITLVLFITLIYSLNVYVKINDAFEKIMINYDENIPEFTLEQGILSVEKKIRKEINDENCLIINTDYTYEQYKKLEETAELLKYDVVTFINSDRLIMNVEDNFLELKFSDLPIELNKQILKEQLEIYSVDLSYKLSLVFGIYLSVFLSYLMIVVMKVIFVACLVSIISLSFGIRLSFSNHLKVAIYSYTLPLLLEVVAMCLVGAIKDYTYYATMALTYVYAIYAIRAIKLDAFIMMFSDKKMKENMPKEFEAELEEYHELTKKEDAIEKELNEKDSDSKED